MIDFYFTRKFKKVALSGLFFGFFISSTCAAVSQAPLGLTEGVSPNMIFTLDESGSMSWGFVPDAGSTVFSGLIGGYQQRRMRAANTNPIAYNPNVIYEIPPAFNVSGAPVVLGTSFNSAPVNGFHINSEHGGRAGRGLVDLSSDYRVVREHRIPEGSFNEVDNPVDDFKCEVNGDKNGDYTCGGTRWKQIKFNLNRSGNKCTASMVVVGREVPVGCSLNSNILSVDLTKSKVPAYYYEFDGGYTDDRNSSCELRRHDSIQADECYKLVWVGEGSAYSVNGSRLVHDDGTLVDGRKNFSIWYSFYKTRALATLSAASIAFYDLSSSVRFTWQDLDTCTSFNNGVSCGKNKIKPFSEKHKGEFYSWLRSVYFNKGTPLPAAMKRAGDFLTTAEPWNKNLVDGANDSNNTYGCRPSYHVLMTDGLWNSTTTSPSSFKHDGSSFSTPDSVLYDKVRPYYDTANGTLADLAMHYWATDLRPALENNVPTFIPYRNATSSGEYWDPRNNPATWQHMVNFIMGLGLTNALDNQSIPWDGSTHSGVGYEKLKDGSVSWPVASSGSANNVYDLWHAAINSRGEFYSVDSPEAMVQAFKDILNRIADRKSSAALPGISRVVEAESDEVDANNRFVTYFYQTSFDSSGWVGDLEKVEKYRKYSETGGWEDVVERAWSAGSVVPNDSGRAIKIPSKGSAAAQLVDFSRSTLEGASYSAYREALGIRPETGVADSRWGERVDYIRGRRTLEGSEDTSFRARESVLGDFMGSRPVSVGGARYLEGFANRLEGNKTYSNFMTETIAGRASTIYVGGNDGMLHAFDASTGVEKFAFIPSIVIPKLNKLTGKNYTHEYFVDGTPTVADVYFDGVWRTILVGTLRAGGKGVFALDITNPDNISLLWEMDESNFRDKDGYKTSFSVEPGYSFSQPTVARLHNGKWAVVVGNGYEGAGSEEGKAALYIIDAVTGSLISSLEVQSSVTDKPNGLSTPKLADYDSDGIADYAYAGDLHGNLWRFDLLGENFNKDRSYAEGPIFGDKTGGIANFKVSYAGKPLFKATSTNGSDIQAVTAPPSIIRHPNRTGYLIVFGTGKYFEETDKSGADSFAQTLYGIWDENTKAEITSGNSMPIARSSLASQRIESEVQGIGATHGKTRESRTISNNTIDWGTKKGWYLDLKVGASSTYSGEMLIEDMQQVGNSLLISTLVPNDDPCANGSSNWLYAINPATGGRTLRHVFDTRYRDSNGDVSIVSGIKFGGEGGVPLNFGLDGLEAVYGDDQENIYASDMTGRKTWRSVPNN